ncbi:hypothetical protein RUM43_001118 [Polyplax serrata]|uniref:Uncharacterized protein n=1 Tax=Polyplax serrata TaxID=468196 RepID=A0AAN8XQ49_POLSC
MTETHFLRLPFSPAFVSCRFVSGPEELRLIGGAPNAPPNVLDPTQAVLNFTSRLLPLKFCLGVPPSRVGRKASTGSGNEEFYLFSVQVIAKKNMKVSFRRHNL